MADARQKLTNLLKEQDNSKPTLPDIVKVTSLTSFDKLDRELLLLLVKRMEVKENGSVCDVNIIYNFKV